MASKQAIKLNEILKQGREDVEKYGREAGAEMLRRAMKAQLLADSYTPADMVATYRVKMGGAK